MNPLQDRIGSLLFHRRELQVIQGRAFPMVPHNPSYGSVICVYARWNESKLVGLGAGTQLNERLLAR
jgi:hypothetical protein